MARDRLPHLVIFVTAVLHHDAPVKEEVRRAAAGEDITLAVEPHPELAEDFRAAVSERDAGHGAVRAADSDGIGAGGREPEIPEVIPEDPLVRAYDRVSLGDLPRGEFRSGEIPVGHEDDDAGALLHEHSGGAAHIRNLIRRDRIALPGSILFISVQRDEADLPAVFLKGLVAYGAHGHGVARGVSRKHRGGAFSGVTEA